jgi:hypothetical protein
MRKFSQRELLEEGFWDSFVKPGARGAWQAAKEVANVVAPEITEPFKKLRNWKDDARERIEAAADPEKAILRFLEDNGYMPIKGATIQRAKNPTKKGHVNYITRVQMVEYGNKGELQRGYTFPTNKDVAIVKMDKDKNLSFVKQPDKRSAKEEAPPVNPPPVQQQSQTPP